MSTSKMLRELRRILAAEGITFTHVIGKKAHPKLTVTHVCGAVQKITMASSPRDEHNQLEDTVRTIHHFARSLHGERSVASESTPEM